MLNATFNNISVI